MNCKRCLNTLDQNHQHLNFCHDCLSYYASLIDNLPPYDRAELAILLTTETVKELKKTIKNDTVRNLSFKILRCIQAYLKRRKKWEKSKAGQKYLAITSQRRH